VKPKSGAFEMIGMTLGHYRIIERIGIGGMGEVFRADDMNLGRQVAMKVLPDVFAGDPERLARFEREARLLASLNHPNIAAIHGLEERQGKRFLVLELVEGQTLEERLNHGRIPLEETLEICRQIAEGLEAAHEKAVIHRDLKPANVKVTPEGKVKILDFGLAKAFQEEPSAIDVSKPWTLTSQMTPAGVIMGTAAYMSPEQTKGKTVDKRADIWSFGCVLYECLTGKRAFQGETIAETLAAILKSEPDLTLLPVETPLILRSLIRQCLQKDPNLRLHDIADARVEMQDEPAQPSAIPPVGHRFPLGWIASACAVALVMGILVGPAVMGYLWHTGSPAAQPVVRSYLRLEPGYWLDGWRASPPGGYDQPTRHAMALSGDGQFIVYSAVRGNPGLQEKPRLYLRRLDQLEGRPIAGTEGGISPFLSPDDRWVGFWADGKLMKVSVEGGVPVALCDVPVPLGFTWGADNRIVFSMRVDSGLSRISADGGKTETLTVPDKARDEWSHRLPHCLPDGRGILFTAMSSYYDMNPRVAVLDLPSQKPRVLIEDAADARYVETGHLVFVRQGMLMAVPFNLVERLISGQPVPAIPNVAQALNTGSSSLDTAAGQFSISASGTLAFASGGILPDAGNSLVWVDRKGKTEPITSFKAPFAAPRLSPEGQRIAYRTLGKERRIWVYDLKRGTATKLTPEGIANYVTWTPDGLRLVFGWSKTGVTNLYWQPADGSSPMERLTRSEDYQFPGSWSPHAETLAFVENLPGDVSDILFLQMSDRRIAPFLRYRFDETCPEFSPDGRWIAYVSNESGRDEVYVQAFSGPGGKWQISNNGGAEPLWSRNGKQLLYRHLDQVLVSDVHAGKTFSAGKPQLLFQQPGYMLCDPLRCWDMSQDGQRFLMVKLEERKPEPVTELLLVLNWFEELKRLAPTRRK
jgi:hypothetical protein